MNTDKEHFGIFIGRFQGFHVGHSYTIDHIIEDGLTPVVFIGSADKLDDRNPGSIQDRIHMVNIVYPNIQIYPLVDKECWDEWFDQLETCIKLVLTEDFSKVTIYTHNKPQDRLDFTFRGKEYKNEFYSKMFEIEGMNTKDLPESGIDLHATGIRADLEANEHNLHPDVYKYLKEIR